ncbi:hypothetical protein Tco_0409607 [Tanacetum coccineum]
MLEIIERKCQVLLQRNKARLCQVRFDFNLLRIFTDVVALYNEGYSSSKHGRGDIGHGFSTNNGITEDVQPPVVQVENQNPVFCADISPVSDSDVAAVQNHKTRRESDVEAK